MTVSKQTSTAGSAKPVVYAPEEEYKAYEVPTYNSKDYEYEVPQLKYEETTPDYTVDYNDDRFQKVEDAKQDAITDVNQTYGDLIAGAEDLYQGLADQHLANADKLAQIQQENTDFAIEKIEQQKEQAYKDYLKEQSGAYVDWQKQSNRYGVEAERQASAGLTGSGYSESSQVAMYNTYQNRVATARESLEKAKLNYNNGINEAILQNNAALAQIYADAYLKQAELALEGALYKNQLIIDKSNKLLEVDQMYYNRWQDVLQQINSENALAEDIRQHNESMKLSVEQANIENIIKVKEAELTRQFQSDIKAIEIQYQNYADYLAREHEKKMLNAKTQAEKDKLEIQHANELEKLAKQLENEKELAKQKLADQKELIRYEYDLKNQPIAQVNPTQQQQKTSNQTINTIRETKSKEMGHDDLPFNMQSVVDAFGPIGEAQLAQLIAEGKAITYVKNGQRYVKKPDTLIQRPGILGVNIPDTTRNPALPTMALPGTGHKFR